eukprot:gene1414-2712_t
MPIVAGKVLNKAKDGLRRSIGKNCTQVSTLYMLARNVWTEKVWIARSYCVDAIDSDWAASVAGLSFKGLRFTGQVGLKLEQIGGDIGGDVDRYYAGPEMKIQSNMSLHLNLPLFRKCLDLGKDIDEYLPLLVEHLWVVGEFFFKKTDDKIPTPRLWMIQRSTLLKVWFELYYWLLPGKVSSRCIYNDLVSITISMKLTIDKNDLKNGLRANNRATAGKSGILANT